MLQRARDARMEAVETNAVLDALVPFAMTAHDARDAPLGEHPDRGEGHAEEDLHLFAELDLLVRDDAETGTVVDVSAQVDHPLADELVVARPHDLAAEPHLSSRGPAFAGLYEEIEHAHMMRHWIQGGQDPFLRRCGAVRSLVLLALVLVSGCRRRNVEERARPVVDERAEPTRQDLERAVCAGRATCAVLDVRSAGKDASGAPLFVVRATTKPELADADRSSFAPGDCVPFEHWLLRAKAQEIVERREILRVCNDGYGAAGIGDDTITVAPNLFTHTQSGGSAWRWESTSTLVLSPLRLVRTESWNGHTLGANSERTSFDWLAFRGHTRWFRPPCPASGAPPETAKELDSSLVRDDPEIYVHDPIPLVALPETFMTSSWKTTALGTCAPILDGGSGADGTRGFVVHGPAADAGDAAMRVVATGKENAYELFVEIVDDAFVTGSAKILHDDHLEIWWKDADVDPSDMCIPGEAGGGAGRLRQWGIRVSDGKLFPGVGAPTLATDPIVVDRADGKDATGRAAVRLRIRIASAIDTITVVYSDGDDGKSQERLVATSRLKFGKSATLGRLLTIKPEEARCEVENGTLARRLMRVFPADRPVLGTME